MTVIFSNWGDLSKTKNSDDSECHQELVYPDYSETGVVLYIYTIDIIYNAY